MVHPASKRILAILAATTCLMSVASAGSSLDQGRSPPRSPSEASTTRGGGGGGGKKGGLWGRGESELEATDGEVQLSAHQMAEWLDEVEVHVMVDVVLVGFHERDGGGPGGGASGGGVSDAGAGAGGAGAGAGSAGSFVALDATVVQEYLGELARGLSTDGAGGVPITVVGVDGLWALVFVAGWLVGVALCCHTRAVCCCSVQGVSGIGLGFPSENAISLQENEEALAILSCVLYMHSWERTANEHD